MLINKIYDDDDDDENKTESRLDSHIAGDHKTIFSEIRMHIRISIVDISINHMWGGGAWGA